MKRLQVEQRMREIVKTQLNLSDHQVNPWSSFLVDLKADSLDLVEIIMAFEDEFQVIIPEDKAKSIKTLGDAIDYVCKVKGIPLDAIISDHAKGPPLQLEAHPASASAAATPSASDCKSCGAHGEAGRACLFCGRAL